MGFSVGQNCTKQQHLFTNKRLASYKVFLKDNSQAISMIHILNWFFFLSGGEVYDFLSISFFSTQSTFWLLLDFTFFLLSLVLKFFFYINANFFRKQKMIIKSSPLCVFVCVLKNFLLSFFFQKNDVWLKKKRKTQKVNKTVFRWGK